MKLLPPLQTSQHIAYHLIKVTMSPLCHLFLATVAAASLVLETAQSAIHNRDNTSLLLPLSGSTRKNASTKPPFLSLAVNASVPSLNISATPQWNCLGHVYGYITLPASCQDVIANARLDTMNTTPKTWGWGQRGSGVAYDYPMPQRFISRTSSFLS